MEGPQFQTVNDCARGVWLKPPPPPHCQGLELRPAVAAHLLLTALHVSLGACFLFPIEPGPSFRANSAPPFSHLFGPRTPKRRVHALSFPLSATPSGTSTRVTGQPAPSFPIPHQHPHLGAAPPDLASHTRSNKTPTTPIPAFHVLLPPPPEAPTRTLLTSTSLAFAF